MTSETALDFQISRYRQMTGEQRLTLALELHDLCCEVTKAGIRQQHPKANEAQVDHLLHQRLEAARKP